MKHFFLLALIFCFNASSTFADNGSFLVLKSTHFYADKNQTEKKRLTRKREAYEVIAIETTKEDLVMFRINVPVQNNIVNGSGFILETDAELQVLEFGKVKVFPTVPRINNLLTNHRLVPSNHLSFTGRQSKSPDFPNLTLRAVNYKTNAEKKYWVPEWSGIYRPDKDAEWLGRTYQTVQKLELDSNLMNKILLGLVEIGFTENQVKLALGAPVKKQAIEEGTKTEWIYNSQKIILMNGYVLRVF
ncbi:hypothetical protein KKA14_19015 [bacterium]|nr:hypothetical protein [bacterium]